MTDYREQAILAASKVFGESVEAMRFSVEHPESEYSPEDSYIRAYVAEREARLRLSPTGKEAVQ